MNKNHTLQELKRLSYSNPIIAFDGVCNLCNSYVNYVIRQDKSNQFKFATLQSSEGSMIYASLDDNDLDSVLLVENGVVYFHSDVALKVSERLSGIHRVLRYFKFVPKGIRDVIYKWVARNRFNWFGKKSTCMVPDSSTKARFL